MAQLSRPYQVALAAIVLLAAVWLLALRGHSSGGGESASTPAPKPSPAASPGAPYTPYKGSAPGVAGLTRAIQKAHGAVGQSERNAKQLEAKSAEASRSASTVSSAPAPATSSRPGAAAVTGRHGAKSSTTGTGSAARSGAQATQAKPVTSAATAGEAKVARLLADKRHFTVALLFWSPDPQAYDDRFVRGQLRQLLAAERHDSGISRSESRELGGVTVVEEPRGSEERIALVQDTADHVASYGSITRAVQVYLTPSLLIIRPNKQVEQPMTGFQTAFAIEQALDEVANR